MGNSGVEKANPSQAVSEPKPYGANSNRLLPIPLNLPLKLMLLPTKWADIPCPSG